MTGRECAFAAMKAGSLPEMDLAQIYGVQVATMNEAELRTCLHWSLSQNARLAPETIGVISGRKH